MPLSIFIHLRLTCLVYEQIARFGVAKQLGHAQVATGRVTKALPHALPLPIAIQHQVARPRGAILLGIKAELSDADIPEGFPPCCVGATLKGFGFGHPGQQVADRITNGEAVKIARVKAAPSKRRDGFGSEHRKRSHHGFARAMVKGDI